MGDAHRAHAREGLLRQLAHGALVHHHAAAHVDHVVLGHLEVPEQDVGVGRRENGVVATVEEDDDDGALLGLLGTRHLRREQRGGAGGQQTTSGELECVHGVSR
jgi:hypothetical protein